LILGAYQKWGEACAGKLLGDYAFAIWDWRRHLFFCARDHFGVKPFFYYHSKNLFAFASEIKALFCVPGLLRRLNEVRVGDFLAANFEDKSITFYENIVRLPQSSYMIVGSQTKQIRQYWTPDATKELRLRSNDEYVEAFQEIFTSAVRCRTRSAFAVGSTLSGGLDSSSVACTASKVLAEEGKGALHTFSAIFPSLAQVDPRIDERVYIDAVLESGQFEPHLIHADQLSPLVETFWQDDEVIPGVNVYMDNAFFEGARQHNVRVLLSGFDGDSVLSHGYERLTELARTFRWGTLFNETTALAQRYEMRRRSIIRHRCFRPLVSKPASDLWQKWQGQELPEPYTGMGIHPHFVQQIGLADRTKQLSEEHDKSRNVREQHGHSLLSGVLSYGIEILDQVAAPFAVEPRHPFFDKRLVEFSLALPLAQKLQQGWPRFILRQAMKNVLPDEIRWRLTKGNLSANFILGLLNKEQATLEDVLFGNSLAIEKYISIPVLQQAYHCYQAKPLLRGKEALIINKVVLLALWLRNLALSQ
jgi:asparagine synthase (glutamine-hydrolysing)